MLNRCLPLLTCILLSTALCQAQPRRTQTIAHRGHWRSESTSQSQTTDPDVPQNSRVSLRRALALGIYGSETDIWLTTDGHIMVNHDATFGGISLQDTTFAACKRLRLTSGERMPELRHLLRILKKSKSPTRLIVEVKKHRDPQRSRDCAAAAVRAVHRRHLRDRVEYISFSIEACQTIHTLDPQAHIAYLSGDRTPAQLHDIGITGIDYNIKKIRQHPEWVAEAHQLGMAVGVWTVDSPDDIRQMQDIGVDYITTNEPTLCHSIVK